MAASLTIHISDELLADLQTRATAAGKTVDQVAAETLQHGIEEQKWNELVEYGQQRGTDAGFLEEQAADIVHQWRREHHR